MSRNPVTTTTLCKQKQRSFFFKPAVDLQFISGRAAFNLKDAKRPPFLDANFLHRSLIVFANPFCPNDVKKNRRGKKSPADPQFNLVEWDEKRLSLSFCWPMYRRLLIVHPLHAKHVLESLEWPFFYIQIRLITPQPRVFLSLVESKTLRAKISHFLSAQSTLLRQGAARLGENNNIPAYPGAQNTTVSASSKFLDMPCIRKGP